ncbi:MAG: phosphohydrolase [Pleomorphochaeta sp.]
MNKKRKTRVDIDLLSDIFSQLCKKTRILQTRAYTHHFGTSLLRHSVNVAYVSMFISKFFRLNVDYFQMVRGALLHDYYLYDCHDKEDLNKKHHLRRHPAKAVLAAQEDLLLTKKEIDIILKHMFPITFSIPKSKESFVVCFSDKICSTYELFTNLGKKLLLRPMFA